MAKWLTKFKGHMSEGGFILCYFIEVNGDPLSAIVDIVVKRMIVYKFYDI